MKVEVGKVYRCGNGHIKIIMKCDLHKYHYIGIQWDLENDRTTAGGIFVYLFEENGDYSPYNLFCFCHQLEELPSKKEEPIRLKVGSIYEYGNKYYIKIVSKISSTPPKFVGVEIYKKDEKICENPFVGIFYEDGRNHGSATMEFDLMKLHSEG